MTAEIAILNKDGVALASDSTVTVSAISAAGSSSKAYPSANKLFGLSREHPVGVMVYGNAHFMGIPWETVIKEYRRKLGHVAHATLFDYASGFIAFLEQSPKIFDENTQRRSFESSVRGYFDDWINGHVVKFRANIGRKRKKKLDQPEVRDLAAQVIDFEATRLGKEGSLSYLPSGFESKLARMYRRQIDSIGEGILGKYQLSSKSKAQLRKIAVRVLCCDSVWPDSISGLVIAGFGEDEVFPSLWSCSPHLIAAGKVIYAPGKRLSISHAADALIVPFAQRDVADTFIQGVDPEFQSVVESALSELSAKISQVVLDRVPGIDDALRNACEPKATKVVESVVKKVIRDFRAYMREAHVDPLLAVVSTLPKDEMAALANSLVGVTVAKRKVSLGLETVGGPVDVAVISKGDGFIWISRKHYFKPEYNLQFSRNYFAEALHAINKEKTKRPRRN
jgi:hypothetical protein